MSELIFDKYEIMNRLAVGGMGEVFYAVQRGSVPGFERPVILKNLLPDLAQQEGFIEQFLDEARVAATLNHPNVVSIYEVGLWNGVYFIAMEFIRGRNISQLIRASVKKQLIIPPRVIARVIHDAALGLDHAHGAKDGQGKPLNIVHRDISPQNIMVRDDGVTKVVDFGIARAANRNTRTATGAVKGKLAYMAPEQIGSRSVTGLADQFALGVVLWEMCTRRRLFHAENDVNLIRLVLESEIQPPSALVPGLPEDFDEIALRMLSRDPKGRYASLAEVARELEAFMVRFSPPTTESPVAACMRQLGTEDLQSPTSKATPSAKNFVISLEGGAQEGKPTAVTATSQQPQARGVGLAALFAVALLLGLGGTAAALFVLRPDEQPVVAAPPPPEVPRPPTPAADPSAEAPPPSVASARLTLTSVPSGAAVRLNGRKRGETPLSLDLPIGEQVLVQLDKPGFAALEQDVTLTEDRALELKLKRREAPGARHVEPPATVEAGYLSIDTVPWTKVTIDGEPFGSTPIFKKKLNVGKHTVVVETETGVKQTRAVEIKAGDVTKLQLDVK